ncbi:MAG: putative transposase [Halieaceae bacterium]
MIDEVFAGEPDHRINGKQHHFWRTVDQDGEVADVYLRAKPDGIAAKGFFKRLLRSHGGEPMEILTDKLQSARVAHREMTPNGIHGNFQYAKNHAEHSYEPRRVRKRLMRRFKAVRQVHRYLGAHAAV